MKRTPTQDPEIFLYENGVYYYRGRPPHCDERIERSLETTDFLVALVEKTKLVMRIENEGFGVFKKAGPLMKNFLEEQSARLAIKEIRPRYYENIKWALDGYLVPFYKDKEIGKIDSRSFDKLRQKYGPRDYKNQRKYLKSFLLWCKSQKLLVHIPEFDVGKHKKRKRMILSKEEILKVLTFSHGNLLLFVAMYLFQGMRRSEITKLKWSYIDLDHRSIALPDDLVKTDEDREFPINNFVWTLLAERKEKATSEYLFPNAKGLAGKTPHMSEGGFRMPFKRMLKRAGVERALTPHDLRATYEKYAHLNKNFTDTQREKMVGASAEVQRRVYLNSFSADDLRGLEQAVDFIELHPLLETKLLGTGGKLGGGENAEK